MMLASNCGTRSLLGDELIFTALIIAIAAPPKNAAARFRFRAYPTPISTETDFVCGRGVIGRELRGRIGRKVRKGSDWRPGRHRRRRRSRSLEITEIS